MLERVIKSLAGKLKSTPNEEARASYEKGNAFSDVHNWEQAITCYQQALALRPNFAEAHNNIGLALEASGQAERAYRHYQAALDANPALLHPCINLGNLMRHLRQFDQARAWLERAADAEPGYAPALANLGNLLMEMGLHDAAFTRYCSALTLDPENAVAHSNYLFAMNGSLRFTPDENAAAHRDWALRHAWKYSQNIARHRNRPEPERRLKVGYLSPDFRDHAVACFIEPLLGHHDAENFDIYCYDNGRMPDSVTRRLQAQVRNWRPISRLSDADAAALVRQDEIDILVDLAGHTADNRLLVFARKPAPIQVTGIGYPNTTGMSQIDYRITDSRTDPPGRADSLYAEKLVRLAPCFLCYVPPVDAPTVMVPKAPTDAAATFGSFNNLNKINDETIETWASLLKQAPKTRLILKQTALASENVRQHFFSAFVRHGVYADRIELIGNLPSRSEHLAMYNNVTIGLDPFPYNGTTTTCEALWMGVPVITLAGEAHVARVGKSLLETIGLTDLIAQDREQYISLAVTLAGEADRLRHYRIGLRERMRSSALIDGARYSRNLEAAYRAMWERWCARQSREPR